MNISRGLRQLFENYVDNALGFNLYIKKSGRLKQNGSSRRQFKAFFLTNFGSKYIDFVCVSSTDYIFAGIFF